MILDSRLRTGAALLAAALFALCPSPAKTDAEQASTAHGGECVIAGTVIGGASGEPLAQAEVILRDATNYKFVAETYTGERGRFHFAHLADGRYQLSASHRGYVTSAYQDHDGLSTAIVAGEGVDTTGLQLTLPPDGSIYGKITEDSGDPVPQARITLYAPNRRDGTGRMMRAGFTVADAMGNFDLGHLAPGNYFLCASGVPWYSNQPGGMMMPNDRPPSALDMAYPIACYPDGADPAGAAPVTVDAGDSIPVNVVMHPVPALHLTFHVPFPIPNQMFTPPQFQTEVFGIPQSVGESTTYSNFRNPSDSKPGLTVELIGVPPGQYQIRLGPSAGSGGSTRYANIDASSGDANLDESALRSLADLSGRVVMLDGSSIPVGLSLALVPEADEENRLFARIEGNGNFHIASILPGRYEVRFLGDKHLAVTGLEAKGAATAGRLIQVGSTPFSLTAYAAEAKASIYGIAQAGDAPAPGVFVLLVPTDPDAGRDAWVPNQSDSDGSFYFPHVPPGDYALVAIQQGWTLDWARPGVIARYLSKGVRVTVNLASRRIDLKEPVKVQTK